MKISLVVSSVCLALSVAVSAQAVSNQKVVWTAVFSNTVPLNSLVTQAYCDDHTPTVMVTTIDQITSKQGVMALNGVTGQYLSYKTIQKDNIYCNIGM